MISILRLDRMSKYTILDKSKSLGEGGVCVACQVPKSEDNLGCINGWLFKKQLIFTLIDLLFLLFLFRNDPPLVINHLWKH